jgi:hypothetical protein
VSERASTPPPEFFDDELAEKLLGRSLLIGITDHSSTGEFLGRRQVCGQVLVADRHKGICVRNNKDGSDFWLPPDTRGVRSASPGEYHNRATGEVVVDPDYLASWTFTKPPPDAGAT